MAIPISVIPYRSNNVCPETSFQLSITEAGKAAEPETINLKLLMQSVRAFFLFSEYESNSAINLK